MEGILISHDDTVTVNFVLAKTQSGHIVADESRKSIVNSFDDLDENTIEEHYAVFKRPSFGDSMDMSAHIRTNDGVSLDFNPYSIRFERMRQLIQDWSLIDDNGQKIKPTADHISQLHPVVANTMGQLLEIEVGGF